MSSGEIMRAVLTESCKFSRPAWYTLQATLTPTPALGLVATATIQTRGDSYFLCMGLICRMTRNSGGGVVLIRDALYQVTRSRDQMRFFQNPQPLSVNGANLAKMTELEEYVLFDMADNVELTTIGQGPPAVVTPGIVTLVLCGLEFIP